MCAIIPDGKTTDWNFRTCTLLCPLCSTLYCSPGLQTGRTVPSMNPKQLSSGEPFLKIASQYIWREAWSSSCGLQLVTRCTWESKLSQQHGYKSYWGQELTFQSGESGHFSHSSQYHAQALDSVAYCSLSTGKLVENPQGVDKKWEVCLRESKSALLCSALSRENWP